jgi:hypothetical protein
MAEKKLKEPKKSVPQWIAQPPSNEMRAEI